MRAAARGEGLEDEKILLPAADLLGDDRREVLVRDLDLPVGELLEARERPLHVVGVDRDPDLLERVGEGVPPRMLAEDDLVALEPDLDRVHDLVGGPVREHAVLVDPALVGERARPHDRLVRLHRVAGERGDEPRRPHDLLQVEAVPHAERLAPRPHDHRDLLERAVARALADPVHRDLHLARAVLDAGQRVRDRETEVVVAVRGDDDLVRRPLAHDPHELAELRRRRVARRCRAR